ncbi:MAG: hypothetical protein WBA97_10265 [Actinophytocola sp.]|uniref:hypothetical protein n=1 Tax=Actinophytocola sp. TaxID=1872138 RepID=UPI003C724ADA
MKRYFRSALLLTPRLQHMTYAVGYSNCVSLSQPAITSGSRNDSFDAVRGCLDLPSTGPAATTVTWNTGQTSAISGTTTAVNVGGQTVFTWQGTVTSGLFTGAGFTEVIAQNSLNLLACVFAPGVTTQSGTGTFIST